MNTINQRKRNPGLSIILTIFAVTYVIGAIYLLLSWVGLQSYDLGFWRRESFAFYTLVFVLAETGVYGVWRWKKWGAYCLVGAWGLNEILNFLFIPPTPAPYQYSLLGILVVAIFFLFLSQSWQEME